MARTKLGEFRRQLEYKPCGITGIGDGRPVLPEFAGMKECHVRNVVNNELTLSDRVRSCGCGEVHRGDINAAGNLKAKGMRLVAVAQTETQNARGATRQTQEQRKRSF